MISGEFKPEVEDYFIKGDPVEVSSGPLKGLVGEVIRLNGQDRLIIKIDAIQHSVTVQINRALLKEYKKIQSPI